ncbi:sulfite exporter TauE/SafE family protein [Acetobacter sp. DsW_063]|uniref:sulfite exporter TauE/SafE family protein n=1 Tax=Acetobacter sp. DsW_063 TaxID=1514894 RepID=UPI000A374465|nr:sulfite exporter TauE/SafE family protein [Acetobacter sp. DsW_063]OUJ16730.1 membrane protein [Acetobacter sp. DsW_063]
MDHLSLLFIAGTLAGAMNALAGGGSLVMFPAFLAAGLPPVTANASSTVALWPGGAASAWTYRAGLHPVCGVSLQRLAPVTLVGGLAGGLLLLFTPGRAFDEIVPWLLLLATLALAFGRRVGDSLHGKLPRGPILLIQFGLGVYGGYFGGAVGLMMLAAWSLLGERDIKSLNGPRTLMVTLANTAAIAAFVVAHAISWPGVIVALLGGLLGGVLGARLGRRLPSGVVRAMTITATALVTAAFFARLWFPGVI